MYDVRTALKSTLEGLDINNVEDDLCYDAESTKEVREDFENIPVKNATLCLGDFEVIDRDPKTITRNRVAAQMEVCILAKSKAARNGINTIADELGKALHQHDLGYPQNTKRFWLEHEAPPEKLNEEVVMMVLTFQMVIWETAGSYTPTQPSIEMNIDDGEQIDLAVVGEFVCTGTFSDLPGTPVQAWWIFKDTNYSNGFILIDDAPTATTTSVTLTLTNALPLNSAIVTCIVLDDQGNYAMTQATGVEINTFI